MFVLMAALLVNTRSMVDECPWLSSLVGTFGLFMSANVRPWSHSIIALVHGFSVCMPLSHLGSLMFQSPAMIVGVECRGMWIWRQSAVHSWIGLLLFIIVFWL